MWIRFLSQGTSGFWLGFELKPDQQSWDHEADGAKQYATTTVSTTTIFHSHYYHRLHQQKVLNVLNHNAQPTHHFPHVQFRAWAYFWLNYFVYISLQLLNYYLRTKEPTALTKKKTICLYLKKNAVVNNYANKYMTV